MASVTFNNSAGWNICSSKDFTESNNVRTCNDGNAVENIDLSNASTNATYLKETYKDNAWIRN